MNQTANFIVVDTEGKDKLHELAVINSQGKLIYEAFAEEYVGHYEIRLNRKPLQKIIVDFVTLTQNNLVVCHSANHDYRVLKNSFAAVGINWKKIRFDCTYKLAKQYFINFPSYSLEYLSKKLDLKVNNKYFNSQQAHTARYDAEFTYQLYRKIIENQELKAMTNTEATTKPNPFGSTRVDTPFQSHPDLTSIHQNQFKILKAIITDIKNDFNHQSKGAVVIGEPGTGKTHLMMRLANELLEHNRLLFIRQPNNPDTVIYHSYSRILESLIEQVGQSHYSQLEHLLANSFVKLVNSSFIVSPNKTDRYILEATQDNALALYDIFGKEGTQTKRKYWEYIEKKTMKWWLDTHGAAGFSLEIIKGIIKFCSYSDPNYKRLVTRWLAADNLEEDEFKKIGLNNWNEDMSKEAFSLEAIAVLSKLSLLDEPLIIIFDQLESLGLEYNKTLLQRFGESIKEIFTHVPNSLIILNLFPDRWQQFQAVFDDSIIGRISQNKVILEKPSSSELKQILQKKAESVGVDFENLFLAEELKDILSQGSIRDVLNRAYDYYRYKFNGISLPISDSNTLTSSPISQQPERIVTKVLTSLEDRVLQLEQGLQNVIQELSILKKIEWEVKPEAITPTGTEIDEPSTGEDSDNNGGKKNTEDSRLIRYLKKEKEQLEKKYNQLQIIEDSDDIGKLRTIIEAFKIINQIEVDHLRLGKRKLPDHFVIKKAHVNLCFGFLQISGASFTTRIKNFNTIVVTNKDIKFTLWRDSRQPAISGKVGKAEIAKFNNADNGHFLTMGKDNRITFELIYKLIVDIQNKDLEIDLAEALQAISFDLEDYKNYWLIKSLV